MIEGSVRLGLMPPLSGLVEIYGPEITWAGQIACQEVNERGGVLGRPLELVIEDDGSLPESAVTAANTLVKTHNCVAIIGNLLSNSRIAVAYRVAEPLKVPYLNFSFYEGSILSRYFFHFAALPNQQIDQMIPYMRNKYGPRMFFAGNNYEWPRGSIDAAKGALLGANGEIVGVEYCSIGVSLQNIEGLLDNVLKADPDVFVPYFAGADQVHLLTRFTERGLKKRMAVVMGHYDEMMASQLSPEVREGFYSSNTYFMTVDTPENKRYLERLSALPEVSGIWPQGNGILTNFGEGTYLCVKAFAKAANNAGSLDPEALVETLETVSLTGPQGEVHMDPVAHHARVNTYLTRCRADGSFPLIETFGAIPPIIPKRYSHQRISHQTSLEEDIRLQSRMLEQMSEGVVLFSINNKAIIYTNAGCERLFDYHNGELIGKHLSQLIAPSDQTQEETANQIISVLEQSGSWLGEIRNVRKGGTPFWCSATVSTFTHPVQGEVWMAVLRDITQLKEMQLELEQHKNHLQQLVNERTKSLTQEIEERQDVEARLKKEQEFTSAILENIEDGIVASDQNGVLSLFNRATREFHCLPVKSIPAEEWANHYDLFLADGTTPMKKEDVPLFRALQGNYIKNIEMVIAPKHGKKRILLASGQPLRDEHENLIGAVVSMHDITERKLAEDVLQKAHDELELKVKQRTEELQQSYLKLSKETEERKRVESELRQAHKMEAIGTLAGGIAHDFNNILTPILGYADMVLEELPEGSQAWVSQNEVIKAGKRAKDLVQQILAFSRQTGFERQPIQVHHVVKEALKFLRASIPTTIEIKQNIDPKCGTILSDPTQIHQIVVNLCTNAYQAMQNEAGVLAISLKRVEIGDKDYSVNLQLHPGSYLNLEVSDTGQGIPPEVKEKIFDPYFTTKAQGEGTGLGLAVVLGIVEKLQGHISVYSEIGQGTTFHVYLPAIESESADVQKTKPVESIPHGNERILVVDDEEAIVQMQRKMLGSLGYQVSAFTSSFEALKMFQQQPENFNLVITDMTMPNMTGAELAHELISIRPDVAIILCTGFSQMINEEKAKALGIREFIMKPVIKSDIAKAIRKVLDAS